MKAKNTKIQRFRRHRRIRAKVIGTSECPRLAVFRSNKHVYAQLIDDGVMKTLASASDLKLKKEGKQKGVEIAREIGKLIGKEAAKLKISKVVFDRAGFTYHGTIKALAEGARESGLTF